MSILANALLPLILTVNTPSQSLTARHQYVLQNGEIMWRANPDFQAVCKDEDCNVGTDTEWRAFSFDDQLPEGVLKPKIKSMNADNMELLLETENGELWYMADGFWSSTWGLPVPFTIPGIQFRQPLKLPSNTKSWSYSLDKN